MTSTPDAPPAPASKPKSGKAKRILGIVALLVLAVVGYEGFRWFTHGRFHQETDDAYLQADLVMLQARDTGYIAEILVAPNAPVAKGQVIARIDPQDYQLALENAANTLASAESATRQLEAQITAGRAGIQQAEAALAAAQATNDGAQKAYRRARELKTTSVGTQAALDSAEASAKSAAAQVESARAALAQAEAQLAVLNAEADSAKLQVRAARTGLRQAQRDLDFTQIRAPFAGILTERQIEVGSYVAPGSRIGTLVPVENLYVGANFKETQIAGIRPGSSVQIRVDAWPDAVLHGTVESLTAGTGQVFSLLPSSNATGNFTKVVQRVPVRIRIDDQDRTRLPLRPGMSVVVEVDTRTGEDRPLMPTPAANPARVEPGAAATSALDSGAPGMRG
ncbi:HlyD family secretion protein [Paracoccus sp. N5]|uniref:HlyD family secretion protein n=1 Tax=Paracoccus sp. N5 TaxID=1101189 RepID=UPI00035C4322|nr:HlyD family secretion protein [Paracoccus sp. N5]